MAMNAEVLGDSLGNKAVTTLGLSGIKSDPEQEQARQDAESKIRALCKDIADEVISHIQTYASTNPELINVQVDPVSGAGATIVPIKIQ